MSTEAQKPAAPAAPAAPAEQTTPAAQAAQAQQEAAPAAPAAQAQELSNSDVRGHALFQKLTSEVAEMRAEIKKRDDAEQAAKTAAEEAKLLEEKNFTELLASKEEGYKKELASLKQQIGDKEKLITERDLKIALTGKGFQNETFLNGAIAGYDSETHGDFAKYAETLAADEMNAAFLNQIQRGPKVPDVHAPNTPTIKLTPAELQAQLKSDDPKKRAEARKVAQSNWKETGATGVA
jgi:hypothetical protein